MRSKRLFGVGILVLFLIGMFGGVLAEDVTEDVSEVSETLATGAFGIFQGAWNALDNSGIPLSRTFMAVLLGMIIYSVMSSMEFSKKAWVNWTIAIAITSLAMLGIPQELVEVLMTQYGAVGATILTIIPFVIVAVFSIRVNSLLIARVTWLFYAGYYFIMYIPRIIDSTGTSAWLNAGALIVGVILFFFIGSIRNLIFKGKMEGFQEEASHKIQQNMINQKLANASRKAEVSGAGVSSP